MWGPQCSGLLLGREGLIEAGWAQSCPWEGAVCRSIKAGKEKIMGLLAALDKGWNWRVKKIGDLAGTAPGVTTDIQIPPSGNPYPTLTVNVGRGRV